MPYKNIEDRRKASNRSYRKCWKHRKLYRQKHRIHKRNYDKKYFQKNIKNITLRHRNHYVNNKERYLKWSSEWQKMKMDTDENFRIRKKLGGLLRKYFLFYLKNPNAKRKKSKYPIDFYAIIEYLKPFPKDISKYHIDHKRPLCSFDFTDPDQIKEAFRPENHQWLLAEENLKKGSRY